jgi:hypothetical protein
MGISKGRSEQQLRCYNFYLTLSQSGINIINGELNNVNMA